MSFTSDRSVYVVHDIGVSGYPREALFHPGVRYPEYPFADVSAAPNLPYDMVRRLFRDMGLDRDHFGQASWNPLGKFIRPGHCVLLKPNLVADHNWGSAKGNTDTDSLVTHASVIRAVTDYVQVALQGRGQVIVGDCPVQGTDWQALLRMTGLDRIRDFYEAQGAPFQLRDFRLVTAAIDKFGIISVSSQNATGRYVETDLATDSLLMPIMAEAVRFGVTDYNLDNMRRVHNARRNAYLMFREAFEADCVINLPKLKFHVKAGMTGALKNLVGLNGHKDYLPHFRMGVDEHPPTSNVFFKLFVALQHLQWRSSSRAARRALSLVMSVLRRGFRPEQEVTSQGGWFGNDTLWRTILDINRAFFYLDLATGHPADKPQRASLIVVDAIVAGDRESPLAPSPCPAHSLLAGGNPVAVDAVGASLLRLDASRLKQITGALGLSCMPLEDIRVCEGGRSFGFREWEAKGPSYAAVPSAGWRSHIERC
jgi:uncharacterized protein (DUF362 family)